MADSRRSKISGLLRRCETRIEESDATATGRRLFGY
jgi:hypothetical protein